MHPIRAAWKDDPWTYQPHHWSPATSRASWLPYLKGRSTVDQVTLLAKGTAGAVLVDLTAAYDTVWYPVTGTVGWLWNSSGCCQIDIWCTSLWSCSQTAALCSRPATDSKADYEDLRMVSPRDLSWPHCCSISTFMTSLNPSSRSMAMPMTWPS